MKKQSDLEIQGQFRELLGRNFMAMAPVACILYFSLGFVDASLAQGNKAFFLGLRLLFGLPTLVSFLWVKYKGFEHIAVLSFLSFVFSGTGVGVISYYLGGITSDYYFGLLIISFLQFTFLPLDTKWCILLDLYWITFFMVINTYDRPYEMELVIKQASNYLSFVIFKFIAASKSRKLIYDNFEKVSLEKELTFKNNVQKLFGELCHLINNPLFISKSVVKKVIRKTPDRDENKQTFELLEKSLGAQKRIQVVVTKMLELQSADDIDFTKYQEFLTNEDKVKEEAAKIV